MKDIPWKPELWQPLIIPFVDEMEPEMPSPIKSFFDQQDLSDTYEVRGILPRSELVFMDQDKL